MDFAKWWILARIISPNIEPTMKKRGSSSVPKTHLLAFLVAATTIASPNSNGTVII